MDDLIVHSITYRVAVRPRAGQKVHALQTVPARGVEPRPGVAQYAGSSLRAGIGVEADQRAKLEVPPPRMHLTRFHGVYAPHAALRATVTPAERRSGAYSRVGTAESQTPRHVSMT
jgi:hypothetical protein